jgi:ubiquinone/menaquinone biosynthesis C-methylase UbiE
MSTSTSVPPEPRHAPEEATRWFNQWHVYRSIVDADWMAHREIFAAIRSWALLRHPGPFTLLDLGCGDAGFIRATFAETGLWAYTGVDASAAALGHARTELAGARFQVRLLEADMLAALRPDSSLFTGTCDVMQRDFPETAEVLGGMARAAGFSADPLELVCDATGFHRLLAFTTGSAP